MPKNSLQATFDPLRTLASVSARIASNAPERGRWTSAPGRELPLLTKRRPIKVREAFSDPQIRETFYRGTLGTKFYEKHVLYLISIQPPWHVAIASLVPCGIEQNVQPS